MLRLENLDTDLQPTAGVIEATRAAVGRYEGNSWLPFTGKIALRQAVADQIARRSGWQVDGKLRLLRERFAAALIEPH